MAAGLKAAQLMNFSKEDRRKDVAAVNKFKLNMADKAQRNKLKNMGIQDAYIRGRMRMRDNLNKNFLKFKQAASREEEEGIVTKIINDQFENSPYKYEGAVVEGKQFGKGRFVQPTVNIVDKYTMKKSTLLMKSRFQNMIYLLLILTLIPTLTVLLHKPRYLTLILILLLYLILQFQFYVLPVMK